MKENEITQNDYYSLSTTARIRTPSNNIPNLITAQDLLVDKFSIEICPNKKKKKIQLTLGYKVCFVIKPYTDLVCNTIVRGHLP